MTGAHMTGVYILGAYIPRAHMTTAHMPERSSCPKVQLHQFPPVFR
jgi:hypothetical protein